ncbi:MAG TPA: hypothetical protein VG456_13210 [Candidatus Sulfopaludibacter sp.]|jgi:excinuclease UvrABC nuclease subunit|nr:hypothetical protein [Candidatus Sulfopaludibacter sp.]
MPFEQHGNRSFTFASITRNAPSAPGVFGLADSREWIYVGDADDIRAELLNHLNHPHEFLKAHPPSGFTFEVCSPSQRGERRSQLVEELAPSANRLVGKLSDSVSQEKERGSASY